LHKEINSEEISKNKNRHLLIKVNDNSAVKENVLKAAKMEKERIKQRPKFIYYRLSRGIQNLFAGIRCLFKYRFKRQEKLKLSKKLIRDFPLFGKMEVNFDWIEGLNMKNGRTPIDYRLTFSRSD